VAEDTVSLGQLRQTWVSCAPPTANHLILQAKRTLKTTKKQEENDFYLNKISMLCYFAGIDAFELDAISPTDS
jgi:hypothetical protein